MDNKTQMIISTQMLVSDLEKEERIALEKIKALENDMRVWEERHSEGQASYQLKKSLANKKLLEIRQKMENAKKDKDPVLTLALNNRELAESGKLRYSKGCAVLEDLVARLIEVHEVLLADKFGLPKIGRGPFAGRPVVCNLLAQILSNGLMVPLESIRYIKPEEIQVALSKWPKKS